MSHSRIALVVLFFAALLVPATPAQAASTVLCTGYTSCSGQGYSHAGYSTHQGTSYWAMYTGTNCTNYVAYRLITTNGMPNKRPAPGVGNARDWGVAMASVTNTTPAVGAVAWWGKSGGNHVAYIEKVVSSSEIWVSESNWSGAFDWRKITKTGGGWPDGIIHFTNATLTSTAAPVVKGTPKVGSELMAAVGTWSPAPSSYSYQWLMNGSPISGATAKTYTPTASTANNALSVVVAAGLSGYPGASATSAPVTVAPGTLTVSARPTLGGTAKVGSRLTVSTGTWSRKDLSYAFQWFSGATPVAGATGPAYDVQPADAGRAITAQVTGSRAGYTSLASSSSASAAVAPGTFDRSSLPAVSGTLRVGSTLTASPGGWSSSPDYLFRWFADGKAVEGARSQTIVLTPAQRGARMQVRVTASRSGFTSRSAASAETVAVASGQIRASKSPTITGDASVGSVLKVDAGAVSPANASVRYQWLRDGKPIPGATKRSRRVATADLGHRLSATVTHKASGYSARTATTSSTKRIRRAAKVSVAAKASGAGTVVFTVSVSASRVAPPGGTLTVRGTTGASRTVKVTRGRAVFTLKGQPTGAQTYRVAYRGSTLVAPATKDKKVTVR